MDFLQAVNEISGKKYQITENDGEDDVKVLKEIVDGVGGWPLLQGSSWNDSNWSLGGFITKIRKTIGHRTDKVFDIASFIINSENANNVSLP